MGIKKIFALLVTLSLLLLMPACSNNTSSDKGGSADSSNSSSEKGGDVGVFTWWADGAEKDGLDALVDIFKKNYPNDKFVNLAVAGGAGSNAKAKLAADLANGNPPDSFQGHAGAELLDYIRAGQIEPVDEVMKELGGEKVFPKSLLDRLTVKDHIYSIPSNVHRSNVVWANKAVLEKAGITTVPSDIDSWLADMKKVKESGVSTPLVVAGTWTQVHLFESVLLADLGTDSYNGLFDGSTKWDDEGVKKAVKHFAELLQYANTPSDGDDWPGATDAVIDGKAAYNVMGDWAVAEFNAKGSKYDKDYIAFPTPGSNDTFLFLADSFTLPKGCKNPNGAKDWLKHVGSAEGQEAFNLAKGSIPARTDVKPDKFPTYQQGAMKSFKEDKIAASITHGAAVSQGWGGEITTAISKFMGSKDQAGLVADLAAAAKKNLA